MYVQPCFDDLILILKQEYQPWKQNCKDYTNIFRLAARDEKVKLKVFPGLWVDTLDVYKLW